jgi:hypothetical protein
MSSTVDYGQYNLYAAIIIGFATISIAILLYLKQKKKIGLIYNQNQTLSLLSVKDNIKDKIEIKYDGQQVTNLYLTTASIKNIGNVPIRQSAFVSPIRIRYNEKIIDCTVIRMIPKGIDIKLNLNVDENLVECEFDLLNPKDSFTLQFISLEKLSKVSIICRIEGLSEIKVTYPSSLITINYNN